MALLNSDSLGDLHEVVHAAWSNRQVSLICGPPGSGKSTLAHQIHARVVELEDFAGDPRTRMRLFGRTAWRIGRASAPDAAIIRGAPGIAERQHHEELCRPSRTLVLLTPAAVCHERITARNRETAAGEHDEVDRWWSVWRSEHPPIDNPWGF